MRNRHRKMHTVKKKSINRKYSIPLELHEKNKRNPKSRKINQNYN